METITISTQLLDIKTLSQIEQNLKWIKCVKTKGQKKMLNPIWIKQCPLTKTLGT